MKQKTARSYQIAVTQDSMILWKDSGHGSRRHDSYCLKHGVDSLKRALSPQDIGLMDSAYIGIQEVTQLEIICPIKRSKGFDLCEEAMYYNFR